jgi:hypothetical protein
MLPIPAVELLRCEVQQTHINHVEIEIVLVFTFLQLASFEYSNAEREAGALNLKHARQALGGAVRGLRHIDMEEFRCDFKERIAEAELAVQQFADCHPER